LPLDPTPRLALRGYSWQRAKRRWLSSAAQRSAQSDHVEAATMRSPWVRDLNLNRRSFFTGAGALAAGGLGLNAWNGRDEQGMRAQVFVARASSYDADLETPIADGLAALGLSPAWAAGKSVLLKPNLVEPTREAPQVNTHPNVVRAAAEVFRRWGAREVLVGEGQGHCRDTDYVLEQSGLGRVLSGARLEFIDLNYDEVWTVTNKQWFSPMPTLTLPTTLRRADLIVSMPKMKTHHWAGVTLSMKNLFGVMPGVAYGWPKNVLHHAGIPESILDINASVQPHLAIVDGIVAMEGDGPIMGQARAAGVLVMGRNLPAVDSTTTRLMGLDPWRITYLARSSGRLGPIAEAHIHQRGEPIAPLVRAFLTPPAWPSGTAGRA
jgi:uncharacterized protein (DUF362 family)